MRLIQRVLPALDWLAGILLIAAMGISIYAVFHTVGYFVRWLVALIT